MRLQEIRENLAEGRTRFEAKVVERGVEQVEVVRIAGPRWSGDRRIVEAVRVETLGQIRARFAPADLRRSLNFSTAEGGR